MKIHQYLCPHLFEQLISLSEELPCAEHHLPRPIPFAEQLGTGDMCGLPHCVIFLGIFHSFRTVFLAQTIQQEGSGWHKVLHEVIRSPFSTLFAALT